MFRLAALALFVTAIAAAQSATLRGTVTDQSGAIVPRATISLAGPDGLARATTTADDGGYAFYGLTAGRYTIQAAAPGLALPQPLRATIRPGAQTVDLTLVVSMEKQQVSVGENGAPAVGVDASANASAVVLAGQDLDALPDNLDDLAADLRALAGPGAGPSGGAIFIDGFSGGQLPPKDAIREIRINQNPFSPEYDRIGLGRIEILTKAGGGPFRGDVGYNFANDRWNSRNAYAAQKAPFHLNEFRNTFSGPLSRRASFFLVLTREWVDNGNAVNAVTLDPVSLAPREFTDTPVATLRRTVVGPRVDQQLSRNHTVSVRYSFAHDDVGNSGTGGFNLLSRAYRNDARSHTLQVTETAVLGASGVNETRFQYFHPRSVSDANTPGVAIQVLGALNGGANPIGRTIARQNNFEFQNYTTLSRRAHTWRFGVRLRGTSETSDAPQNFGGTFTFGGRDGVTSIESYRRTLVYQRLGYSIAEIRALGGGPSQYTVNAGNPEVSGGQADIGVFAGDDWKPRPNLTVSLGLRYETQTNVHDATDLAPRIGVAWAPGVKSGAGKPKTVLRAGFGVFYDRFALANTLTATRYNGTLQRQYIIPDPDFFPDAPPVSSFNAVPAAIWQVSAGLRAPYLIQTAVSFERGLPGGATAALTYTSSHGVHMLRSRDVNTPIGGAFPYGHPGPLFLMESTGVYNQNQLLVTVNAKLHRDVSISSTYTYGVARSDTDGVSTFPADPYTLAGEYGPAASDIRHRVTLTGSVVPHWGIRFSPLLTANSGQPFDITSGRDPYGNGLFNARPGVVSVFRPGVIATAYGLLAPEARPGELLLGRNAGRGPGQIMLNMRVGRTFAIARGHEGGALRPPSNPRYNLTVSLQIRNLTNHNNPGPIVGNIASPIFGRANQPAGSGNAIFSESANNRRFELQTKFTF